MFVGRDQELQALEDALRFARAGTPQSLTLEGEPGIGKTALLRELRAGACGFRVLELVGAEAEEAIPLAGLVTLLRPWHRAIDGLAEPHAGVLRRIAAEGLASTTVAMGLAVLELLSVLSDEAPVLLLVDDVQWVDEETILVLGFARRRLHGHRVATVFAGRPGAMAPDPELRTIHLGGLGDDEVEQLLGDVGVTEEVARRCGEVCGGNPLAVLELGRALSSEQRTGHRPLPDVVPVGSRLRGWLSGRLDVLPQPTRDALAVLALAGNAGDGVIANALALVGLAPSDLDAAEAGGVLRRDQAGTRFSHPLYASLAVQAAAPPHRRAAHRALAASLPAVAVDRAWHLAEGCEGDGRDAVEALAHVADQAVSRGAHLTAADAWERISRLTREPDVRARSLVAAGEAAWSAGRPDLAAPWLREARSLVPPGPVRARATALLGHVHGWTVSVREAVELLQSEVPTVEAQQPTLAVELLSAAAGLSSLAAAADAPELGRRAEEAGARCDDVTASAARTVGTHVRLAGGDTTVDTARLTELDDVAALLAEAEGGRTLVGLAQMIGFDLMLRERWPAARSTFAMVVRTARAAALDGELAFASGMAAEVAWRTGRWSVAKAEALVDAELHAPVSQLQGTFGGATLARVEVALGAPDAAREQARLAVERGDRLGMRGLSAWGRHALGFASLVAGDAAAAVEHLAWIWRLAHEGSVTDPGTLWWQGDLLEAMLAIGDRAGARRLVDELADQAAATGRVWPAAIADRGRGLLTGTAEPLERSVDALDALGAPFEAARSRLALALLLGDDTGDAVLGRALHTFHLLGAEPWIRRAREQTAATPAGPPQPALAGLLSPAELRVALAVGQGLTNREAADALAISPRTVDAHLQAIYRKVGVRSRTQLALRVGGDDGALSPS